MSVRTAESIINGRFKVTERPLVTPGKCAACGSVERPVVDFGLDIDFYGAVLLCVQCVGEAHEAFNINGQTPTTQPSELLLLDSKAGNEYLIAALDSVNRLRTFLGASNNGTDLNLQSTENVPDSATGTGPDSRPEHERPFQQSSFFDEPVTESPFI